MPAAKPHLLLHFLLLQQTVALVPTGPTAAVLVDANYHALLRRQLLHMHSLRMLMLLLPLLPPPLVPSLLAAVLADLLLKPAGRLFSAYAVAPLLQLNKLEVLHIPAPACP